MGSLLAQKGIFTNNVWLKRMSLTGEKTIRSISPNFATKISTLGHILHALRLQRSMIGRVSEADGRILAGGSEAVAEPWLGIQAFYFYFNVSSHYRGKCQRKFWVSSWCRLVCGSFYVRIQKHEMCADPDPQFTIAELLANFRRKLYGHHRNIPGTMKLTPILVSRKRFKTVRLYTFLHRHICSEVAILDRFS